MRSIALAATGLTLSIMSGCEAALTSCRELAVGGVTFTGLTHHLTRQTRYVRVVYRAASAATSGRPFFVRVGNGPVLGVDESLSAWERAGVPELPAGGSRSSPARRFGLDCRRERHESFVEVTFADNRV